MMKAPSVLLACLLACQAGLTFAQAPPVGQGGAAPSPPFVFRGDKAIVAGPQPHFDPASSGCGVTSDPATTSVIYGSDTAGFAYWGSTAVPANGCHIIFSTPFPYSPTLCVINQAANDGTNLGATGKFTALYDGMTFANFAIAGISSWHCFGTPPLADVADRFDDATIIDATAGTISSTGGPFPPRNTTITANATGNYYTARSTQARNLAAVKMYVEFATNDPNPPANNDMVIGVGNVTSPVPNNWPGRPPDSIGLASNGSVYTNGAVLGRTGLSLMGAHVTSVAIGFNSIWWRVDGGTWNNNVNADPATGLGGYPVPAGAIRYQVALRASATTTVHAAPPFTYAVPQGYAAWGGAPPPLPPGGLP